MLNKRILLSSCLLSLLTLSFVWQFAEVDILKFAEKTYGKISKKPFNQIEVFDTENIPMSLYKTGEKHYNPLFISEEARAIYLQESKDIHRFIQLTDWLLQHGVETDSTFYLSYDFDFPIYNQHSPWHSALAQASIMNSLALRAGFERDLDIYKKAMKAFNTLIPGVGDVSVALSDSSYWYMEYPASEPYFALSGMIGVLTDLKFFAQLTGEPRAEELFQKGYTSVIELIDLYDYGGGFSYYDLQRKKNGRMYHQKQIQRVEELNNLQPHPSLHYFAERWRKGDSYPVLWQFVMNPRPKRILAFSLPFILLWLSSFLLLGGAQKTAANEPEHS